jgi:ligand-binding sensor protein
MVVVCGLVFVGSDVEALRREMDARDEEWQKKLKQKENELEELRKVQFFTKSKHCNHTQNK